MSLLVLYVLGLKNTSVNDKWLSRFMERSGNLSVRETHASNRKKDREWNTERCEEYIGKLQKLYDEGSLLKAEQCWNLDETAFNTAELFDKVIARKGRKQIPSQFDGTEKECVTVLPCGNAAGLQLKFMALYSGVVHVQSRLDDTHGMCYHAVNSCGYMDEKHFAEYIRKEVFPAMTDNKVGLHHDVTVLHERILERSLTFLNCVTSLLLRVESTYSNLFVSVLQNVLFVDGHFSHISNLLLVQHCQEILTQTGKRVEIFCLPAGQTNKLQPFDVSAFGGVKNDGEVTCVI